MRPARHLAATALCGGLLLVGGGAARADCASDIELVTAEIAEVEGAIPLAENPDLPLGPGFELPPQRRSTSGPEAAPGVGEGEVVTGATPSGQEIVPDQQALTGYATEGFVPGPAEENVASGDDPGQGLMGAPSRSNQAAGHLARAKLTVSQAQDALNAGDRDACYEKVDEAKDLVSEARAAVAAAAGGKSSAAEERGEGGTDAN